ncbi:HDOD domain-containing protein [Actomonas aquatica]|uniref:HDOD domain-containing protein n=1 Tax=Actomonas aquatica TaxID=2866162 RepID=A0ABZ1CEF2_9BACT|nr:HDOD domain-containing protein [Opitutus sp. WL0086]WRQ89792.1 HDOD domain-containing protein [Opitutus sp. WL0086]
MLAADLPSYAFERAAEKLSAGPRVFAQLVEMMLDPRTDIEGVADLLKRDAVLSARILRVANSAAVGGQASGSIADLEEALQRVGLSEVYRIAGIAVTLQSAHASLHAYGIGCQRLRENALFEAVAAEAIETVLDGQYRMAYAGGLLRNYGRLLLDRVVQLYRPHSTSYHDSPFGSLVEWERDNFRTTGAQAGADLMLAWRFPEALVLAVRHAAAPMETRSKFRLATVLNCAAAMASAAGHGLPGEDDLWEDDAQARELLGLDGDKATLAKETALGHFERWRQLMQ